MTRSHGSQRAVVFSRHTYYSADFPYWQENDIFLMILFSKMLFFHYNTAKAFFAINLKGTEYGRSEKSTVLEEF